MGWGVVLAILCEWTPWPDSKPLRRHRLHAVAALYTTQQHREGRWNSEI